MGGADTIEDDNVAARSGLGTPWAGNGVSAQGAGRGATPRAPMSRHPCSCQWRLWRPVMLEELEWRRRER